MGIQDINSIEFSEEEALISNDWELGASKRFIGRLQKDKDEEGWIFTDLRRPEDFTKIDEGLEIKVNHEVSDLEENRYYSFGWNLSVYDPRKPTFSLQDKTSFIEIKENEIVNLLYNQIMAYPPGAKQKAVKTIDILKNQLTASGKEIFIYELLQNANDYPRVENEENKLVDVEFHITDAHLFFFHTGEYFNESNVAALCDYNDRDKTAKSDAIGYKGIGFKTVFAYNDYVYLQSGGYSFCFDREKTKNKKNIPWQILPIPTLFDDLNEDIKEIFSSTDKNFRVKFAIRPIDKDSLRKNDSNFVKLFQDTFDSERVILFIPHIRSVKINFHDNEIGDIYRSHSSDIWCVSEENNYVGDIPNEITDELNSRIDKQDGKIPDKYRDFKKTAIGFACKKDGRFLRPVTDSCLYCYLPAKKAQWGFDFLMNTDMIPTGDRQNVEPKENVNHAISKIAGQQFFRWIQNLIKSGEYDYDSVFGLIPDFNELIRHENDNDTIEFLKEFKEGFEKMLLSEEGDLIPVINEDGVLNYDNIKKVNFDTIGISCSNIISDKELLNITEWIENFPHPDLRDYDNKCLKTNVRRLLNTYSDENYIFRKNALLENCDSNIFQEWLLKNKNSKNFLLFLQEKNLLLDFKDKKIFLTEGGTIYKAGEIFENIDEDYEYLKSFDEFLPRLSLDIRDDLRKSDKWENLKDLIFKKFDTNDFVNNLLLHQDNIDKTKQILRQPEASYLFYDFLSRRVNYRDAFNSLPVISDINEKPLDNFERNLYLPGEEAMGVLEQKWVGEEWYNVISKNYSVATQSYFKENLGVKDFSIEDFIDTVLFTDKSRNSLVESPENHPDFFYFCYLHSELFKERSLNDYALLAIDKDGKENFILSEDNIYFDDEDFKEAMDLSWIQNGWMHSLSNKYLFFDSIDKESAKNFLKSAFGVKNFSIDSLIKDVVLPKADSICKAIGLQNSEEDTSHSIAVLKFIGENFNFFEENQGFTKFISLPLFRYDSGDGIRNREVPVFLYDNELKNLLEAEWTPADFVYMLEESYTKEVFNLYPRIKKQFDIHSYSFEEIKKYLLLKKESLIKYAYSKDKNVSLHRFFCNNAKDLSSNDYKNLQLFNLNVDDINGSHISSINDVIYMPDAYFEPGRGIESFVREYVPNAKFLSPSYIEKPGNEEEKKIWFNYFESLGVLTKIKDLVFNSIIPNLEKKEDENILTLLGDYYDELHHEENWNKYLPYLKKLKVRAGDRFLPLNEAIFVEIQSTEPFPGIQLSNQISSHYNLLKENAHKLFKELIKETGCKCIDSLEIWRKSKLETYLKLQEENPEEAKIQNKSLIIEIAKTYQDYSAFYKPYTKQIKLLNADNLFYPSSELTEGSLYEPVCDFQSFGFGLNYINDCYFTGKENLQPLKNLLKDMDVKYAFRSQHLPLLASNYEFAVYFWTKYIVKAQNFEHVKTIPLETLNQHAIIPTSKTGLMKQASVLYSKDIIGKYVKNKINDCEAFMPLEMIFENGRVQEEFLSKFPFKKSLASDHCLEALFTCGSIKERQEIIFWLAQIKGEANHDLARNIYENEEFLWQTGKGKRNRKLLKHLLLLKYDDKATNQLFGKSDNVLSQDYFYSKSCFEEFCKTFELNPISITSDFERKYSPDPDSYDYKVISNEVKTNLKFPLLIIATTTFPDIWKEKYSEYEKKLEEFEFIKCDSISINYKEILKNSSIHYHREENRIHYVNDLKSPLVFQTFVKDLVDILDLEGDLNQVQLIFFNPETTMIYDLVNEEIINNEDFRKICRNIKVFIADREPEPEPEIESLQLPIFGIPTSNILEEGGEDTEEFENILDEIEETEEPSVLEKGKIDFQDVEDSHPKTFSESDYEEKTTTENENKIKREKQIPKQKPKREEPSDYDDWKPSPPRSSGFTIEHYKPKPDFERNIVEWKKDIPQAELGVAEVTEEEASTIVNLIGGAKSIDEIIDENLVARYRMYNALVSKGYQPNDEMGEFIKNKSHDNNGVRTNRGFIHTRSARGGLLFLSGLLWKSLVEKQGRICMYYGNKAYDFEIIESVDQLIKFVGKDNIIIQVVGDKKKEIIDSIFSGKVETSKAHVIIRIKSNSRYNSMFETSFNSNDENDVDF